LAQHHWSKLLPALFRLRQKKKSDDIPSPKEQSKLTDTQKEDSTVDFNNGDNKRDDSHENCRDAKGSCGPGFKLRKGNCVKDVFINVGNSDVNTYSMLFASSTNLNNYKTIIYIYLIARQFRAKL